MTKNVLANYQKLKWPCPHCVCALKHNSTLLYGPLVKNQYTVLAVTSWFIDVLLGYDVGFIILRWEAEFCNFHRSVKKCPTLVQHDAAEIQKFADLSLWEFHKFTVYLHCLLTDFQHVQSFYVTGHCKCWQLTSPENHPTTELQCPQHNCPIFPKKYHSVELQILKSKVIFHL